MGMILRIASSRIVGQGDVGYILMLCCCFLLKATTNDS